MAMDNWMLRINQLEHKKKIKVTIKKKSEFSNAKKHKYNKYCSIFNSTHRIVNHPTILLGQPANNIHVIHFIYKAIISAS